MKKIIFEQTGNIIMILLTTLGMIQTVLTATVTEEPFSFSFEFGIFLVSAYRMAYRFWYCPIFIWEEKE